MAFRTIGIVTTITAGVGLWMATIALPAGGPSVERKSAIAEEQSELATSEVDLVLRIDESDVALEGAVTVEFALFNASDDSIYVYHEMALGVRGGVVLQIEDADGRPVRSPALFDADPVPPATNDRYVFARLEPAHFLGGRVTIKVRHLVPTRGHYSIFATYLCPLPKRRYGSTQPEPRTVWMETGKITSNAVAIDVR